MILVSCLKFYLVEAYLWLWEGKESSLVSSTTAGCLKEIEGTELESLFCLRNGLFLSSTILGI